MTDSATGGPLLPAKPPAPTPLEGKALLQFLQSFVVGLTGLKGDMVRPRWQAEAPTLPTIGDAWAAIGVGTRKADAWPYVKHITDAAHPSGADQLQRHEELAVLCSFYDSGVSGLADFYASLLRDGLAIAQNREILQKAGMGLIAVEDMLPVPSLVKVQWLYRVDLPFGIRRAIVREYSVLNIEEVDVTIKAQFENLPVITRPLSIKSP